MKTRKWDIAKEKRDMINATNSAYYTYNKNSTEILTWWGINKMKEKEK